MKYMIDDTNVGGPGFGGAYPGLGGVAIQNYAPIAAARELSASERAAIERGQDQWIARIAPGYKTPLPAMLSSPTKGAILGAAIPAGLGLLAGAVLTAAVGSRGTFAIPVVTGALLGALGAPGTYFSRRQRNEDIVGAMEHLPEGATKRDILSDPAYQRDLDRRQARNGAVTDLALIGAGMAIGGSRGARS